MDDLSGAKPAHASVQAQARDLLEHLELTAQHKVGHATLRRFVALVVLLVVAVGVLAWLQVDARSTERLRTELVRQCEQRNADTQALRAGLGDAGVQSDDVDVSNSLIQTANALKDLDCEPLNRS